MFHQGTITPRRQKGPVLPVRKNGLQSSMLATTDDFSHHGWFTDAAELGSSYAGSRLGSGSSPRNNRGLTQVTALTAGKHVGGVSYSPLKDSATSRTSSVAGKAPQPPTKSSSPASVFSGRRRAREAEEARMLQQSMREGGTDNLYYVIPTGPLRDGIPLEAATGTEGPREVDGDAGSDTSLVEDIALASPNEQRQMEPIYLQSKVPRRRKSRPFKGVTEDSGLGLTLTNLATTVGGSPAINLDKTLSATAILSSRMHQAMAEAQLLAKEGGARMRLSILNAIPNVMPTFAALQSLVRETYNRLSIAEAAEREALLVSAQKEQYLIDEHEKAVAIIEREGITALLSGHSRRQKELIGQLLVAVDEEAKVRRSFEVREERVRSTQVRLWRKVQTDVAIAERLVALLAFEDQQRFKLTELETKHRRQILKQVSEEVLNVRSVNPMGLCPFYDGDHCPFTPDDGAHGQQVSYGHYRKLPAVLEARFKAISSRSPDAGRERQQILESHRSSIITCVSRRRGSEDEEDDGREDMTQPIFVREVKHYHKLMKALDGDIVTSDNTKGTTLRRLLGQT